MVSRVAPIALTLLIVLGSLTGQRNRPPGNSPGQQRFENSAPSLGESLPDLEAYDERGNSVRLADLKGRHTVLVFGCLT